MSVGKAIYSHSSDLGDSTMEALTASIAGRRSEKAAKTISEKILSARSGVDGYAGR